MKRYFLFLLFTIAGPVQAQVVRFSGKPENFIAETQAVLASTQNPIFIAIGKSFEDNWVNNSSFSGQQKASIIAITNSMATKGYKPAPHFVLWYETLVNAISHANVSPECLDSFLGTAQKTIEISDVKTFTKYLEISDNFFAFGRLYASNYNRLYMQGGTYLFRFNDQTILATAIATQQQANLDSWDNPSPVATAPTPPPTEPAVLSVGPIILWKNTNLTLATANDSVTVSNTNATLNIKEGIIQGNNGTFTWAMHQLPQAYAVLNSYTVDIRNPKITSSDALLTYENRLEKPLKGVFEFSSKKRPLKASYPYPKFMSAQNNASLKGLNADVSYFGGFSLIGSRMYGSSINGKQAIFVAKHSGKNVFRATSNRFELGDSLLASAQASIAMYIESDSIFHPAIKFSYLPIQKLLKLSKLESSGFRDTPYSNSYHKVDIVADVMRWRIPEQKMDFSIVSGKNVVPALFESFDYFDPERYASLGSSYNFHPLQLLINTLRGRSVSTFVTIAELSGTSGRPYLALQQAMIAMQQGGYIDYDLDLDAVRLSRKGRHYVESYTHRKDYDTLLIPSFFSSSAKDSTSNATLNLSNNILTIRGIKQFRVSDSLRVNFSPQDRQILMGKNREFSLNGELKTGNFRFRGQNLIFNYEKFEVQLNKIDSITFIPQKVLAKGGKTEIGGDLRYSNGIIYINKTDNKSGRKFAPEYPRLVIPEGVIVYFDQMHRTNGAYTRNKTYFKIPTIDYDSLNVKDIDFSGTFYSGGVFPPFQETLVAMSDNSLGFKHKPTAGGYKIYGSESSVKFDSPLKMDENGLTVDGEINHLTARLKAKDILFTPDSLVASGTTGEINDGSAGKAYFPKVDLKNYTIKWIPKADSMLVRTNGGSFDFFGGNTRLQGELLLRNSGLFGSGIVKRFDSETVSQRFRFDKDMFTANPADIRVGSLLRQFKPFLYGKNVNINFNVLAGLVTIQTPPQGSGIDSVGLYFPYSAYRTSINRAEWNINAKTIQMKGDVSTSIFECTNLSQEGLTFNGSEAIYDIEKTLLNIKGIPYVKTADARILPEGRQIFIRRDAEMQPFKDARVEIDTLFGYHKMTKGNIQVLSKKRFEGYANYQYVNSVGDTTSIKMSDFETKEGADPATRHKIKYTQAKATILEIDKFFISPRMRYKGDIVMKGNDKNLLLDGFVQLQFKRRRDLMAWIPYKASNKEAASIEVRPDMKADGNTLFTGLHARTGSSGLYATFLSPKEDPRDEDLFLASGLLIDAAKNNRFEVISAERAAGKFEGNRYTYDDTKGIIQMEGLLNLFKPSEFLPSSGIVRVQTDSSKFQLNTLLVLNFPLFPQAFSLMGERIAKTNVEERVNTAAAEDNNERLLLKIAQIAGDKAVETFKDRVLANEYVPMSQFSQKFTNGIVLSNVNIQWSDADAAFYSIGKIGVASIGNIEINAQMDGLLEIRKNNGNDELYLYLEATPGIWYYFGYKDNQLGIISSDTDLNNLIASRSKNNSKAKEYTFTPVGEDEKMLYVERFGATYRPRIIPKKTTATAKKDQPVKQPEKKAEEKKEGF